MLEGANLLVSRRQTTDTQLMISRSLRMESAFTRDHQTVLKFDVHLFPRKYHVTLSKKGNFTLV